MANTIAFCTGISGERRTEASRLGSRAAEGRAQTYRTFAQCRVNADGSGELRVMRDDKVLHHFEFGPENEPKPPFDPEEEAPLAEDVSPSVRRVTGA